MAIFLTELPPKMYTRNWMFKPHIQWMKAWKWRL